MPGTIVQVCVSGVGSALPETSTARTSKVCSPRPRLYVVGLWQTLQSGWPPPSTAPSMRHSNVTGLALSAPVNRKSATSSVLGSNGASSSVVFGAIWSPPPGPPTQVML